MWVNLSALNTSFSDAELQITQSVFTSQRESKEVVDKFLVNHKGITLQDKFINARRLVSTIKRVIL